MWIYSCNFVCSCSHDNGSLYVVLSATPTTVLTAVGLLMKVGALLWVLLVYFMFFCLLRSLSEALAASFGMFSELGF